VSLFEPLFAGLNTARVRYVVVGGVAVLLHGFARLTGDVDLALDLEPVEARKAVAALAALGCRPRLPVDPMQFADPAVRAAWIRDRGLRVFSFWSPSQPMLLVDCFAENPIPFADLWERAESVQLATTRVPVASIADLIALKRLADRPQDREDIEALLDIQRRKGGPGA
jgi:hypothetical protein